MCYCLLVRIKDKHILVFSVFSNEKFSTSANTITKVAKISVAQDNMVLESPVVFKHFYH